MSGPQAAIWSGELQVFGKKLRCYVLESGARIIDADDLNIVLGAVGGEATCAEMRCLAEFCAGRGVPA